MKDKTSRRGFLDTAAKTTTLAWAAHRAHIARAAEKAGPNDRIGIGVIGYGTRGTQLMGHFLPIADVQVTAVCEVDDRKRHYARGRAGGDRIHAYKDYRKLLEDPDVDAVVIATPPHWHALQMINACQAGKDVYVEKPLATTIAEGRAMISAAKKYDRIVQVGTQQRSGGHYQQAIEIVQSGQLGTISEVEVWDYRNDWPGYGAPPDEPPPSYLDWDLWLGPARQVPYNANRYSRHYWFFGFGGGWPLDWAVHHYDIVNAAMEVTAPVSAVALSGHMAFSRDNDNREWPDTFSGILQYGPCDAAPRGFVLQYSFGHGSSDAIPYNAKCFRGTHGKLELSRWGYKVIGEKHKGKKAIADKTVPASGYSFQDFSPEHVGVFVEHVRNHTKPITDVEQGHFASNPGHLMNIAWRVSRKINWDAENERIMDDDEANGLLTTDYREPWTLSI